jgi:hypothetical protein
MFDEASAVELVTEVLVEGVCVWSMVAAGDLDTEAAVRPGELLGGGNEQPTDAALAIVGSDDETRDATKRAVGMKERDAMKGGNANNALRRLSNENGCAGRIRGIRDASLNVRDWRGITERRQ